MINSLKFKVLQSFKGDNIYHGRDGKFFIWSHIILSNVLLVKRHWDALKIYEPKFGIQGAFYGEVNMWSPLQKYFLHNQRIHLCFSMLNLHHVNFHFSTS
jgi:hypothetical protein